MKVFEIIINPPVKYLLRLIITQYQQEEARRNSCLRLAGGDGRCILSKTTNLKRIELILNLVLLVYLNELCYTSAYLLQCDVSQWDRLFHSAPFTRQTAEQQGGLVR